MVDEIPGLEPESATSSPAPRTRRRAASRPAGPPQVVDTTDAGPAPTADAESAAATEAAPTKRAPARKRTAAKVAAQPTAEPADTAAEVPDEGEIAPQKARPVRKSTRKAAAAAPAADSSSADQVSANQASSEQAGTDQAGTEQAGTEQTGADQVKPGRRPVAAAFVAPLFVAPDESIAAKPRRSRATPAAEAEVEEVETDVEADEDEEGARRRRRRRGGRGRRRRGEETGEVDGTESAEGAAEDEEPTGEEGAAEDEEAASRRRRRRRRRGGEDGEPSPDDPPNTVVKVRQPRNKVSDEATGLKGSTRLEAKKQRRREGREAGRRRAPILTEAEFLARRESVNRVMAVRQVGDRTQIAVLEDGVLVEHYVTRGTSSSMVGNVYLGRVQNVLPSMEAAFVDIGRGRNAVLYAGEVNWDAAGLEGQPKRIELALKSGDAVLVQITKDPVGQKGARLTSQISLPGRFLVYVPGGSMTGISRKLPDTERSRLKSILKRVMPEDAGVIVRTAAEGAPEEALEQDVARLQAQWEDISARAKSASPPTQLSSEPDLAIKVVRDIFNEDVNKLVVSGSGAWASVNEYLASVAPDLVDRLEHWVANEDIFSAYRVDEQLAKALDRKVYLPSGGSLVIDRTEAMTVVDVNTGKFTGQGGNLEQTVTRNNIEAAEEIVRQLRLRDIGGIIVVDFIDMVLESNRDLVLRRLVECLGRDRTKHQVAEVTSLGLVQMTRKRIGSGLLESFSVPCEHCAGRGLKVSLTPVDHEHVESPRHRRPANAVDPADVAARALAAVEVGAVGGVGNDADLAEAQLPEDLLDGEILDDEILDSVAMAEAFDEVDDADEDEDSDGEDDEDDDSDGEDADGEDADGEDDDSDDEDVDDEDESDSDDEDADAEDESDSDDEDADEDDSEDDGVPGRV